MVQKATLCEVNDQGDEIEKERTVTVQFNPESLRISHGGQVRMPASRSSGATNEVGQGDYHGSTPPQRTGPGLKRLSVQLWFDVTSVLPLNDAAVSDVRTLTEKIIYFITSRKTRNGSGEAIPLVQFKWGTLIFRGVMDSLEENLEFFSSDGVPLRASVNIGISEGIVVPDSKTGAGAGFSAALNLSAGIGIGASAALGAGTQPLAQAEAGVSLQAMASASLGADADWQSIAAANGIENPRLLQPGQLINMNARASASVSRPLRST